MALNSGSVAVETRRDSGAWKTKHARILTSALDEFIVKGFTGASMDRIAQKAKVSKVTIYNHFENKDLLYRQMVEQFLAHLHPGIAPPPHDRSEAPRQLLTDYGMHMIEVTGQPRTLGLIRLLRADPQQFLGAPLWTETRLLPDGRALAQYLAHETERKRLAVEEPLWAARQLNGMLLENTIYPALVAHGTGARPDGGIDLSKAAVTMVVKSCVETFLRRYGL